MGIDLLSDALSMVRLTGAVIFSIKVDGPWCITSASEVKEFAPVLPRGTDHLVAFHVLLSGDCWLRCPPTGLGTGSSG
jgi:AraC family transcriptional regulator, alkane utilization regulator